MAAAAQSIMETNPPSVRWHVVKTPHFRIIYPRSLGDEAQRLANTFEHIYEPETTGLGAHPRRMAVVMQELSVKSNGFVAMSPPRTELYGMPPQDYNFNGTVDWYTFLASHEYRHIVQYEQATVGSARAVRTLLGPGTFGSLALMAMPYWLWEGDAVSIETSFTRSGRGDIPNFGLVFRTQAIQGNHFSYDKQYLGSYKDFLPDYYVLGYHMVSYLRHKVDKPEVWGRVIKRTMRFPFFPTAFSSALHKESGYRVKDLYDEMRENLGSMWSAQTDTLRITSYETVNKRSSRDYTNYEFPAILGDGRIIALKRGIDDYATYVTFENGVESKLFVPGFLNQGGRLSSSKTKLVWNEFTIDPRWRGRSYSVIMVYDVTTRKVKKITSRSRYAGAAISPNGEFVATIETDIQNKTSLKILNSVTGQQVDSWPASNKTFFSMPSWADDKTVILLKTAEEGRSVISYDRTGNEMKELIPPGKENIGHPLQYRNYLLFNSAGGGLDNIHAVDLATGNRFRVTNSRFGAYNAIVTDDGSEILYNEQTALGMDIVRIPFNPSQWMPFEGNTEPAAYDPQVAEGQEELMTSVPGQSFPDKKYHPLLHLFAPYQWGVALENSFTDVFAGLSTQDLLHTTSLEAGYRYDPYEETGSIVGSLSYQGLYPIIDLSVSGGDRKVNEGSILVDDGSGTTAIQDLVFRWHEWSAEGGLRLPLAFLGSRYTTTMRVTNNIGWIRVNDFRNDFNNTRTVGGAPFFDYVGNGNLYYNHFSASASRIHKLGTRDINGKWGQSISFNYSNTLPDGDYHGGLASASGYALVPGLLKHHSIYGYAAYQHNYVNSRIDDYFFRNAIRTPRGQSVYRFEDFYTLSGNYTLPLWYPDIHIGPLVNFQRVRANLFYDYGYGEKAINTTIGYRYYTSAGFELLFDANFFRLLSQIAFGVRFSYGIHPATTRFDILLGSINL